MSEAISSCADSPQLEFVSEWGVFDFGTSPHGLSAKSLRTHQETSRMAAPSFLADGVGGFACESAERLSASSAPFATAGMP
jgi:hypothetical protein